MVIFKPTAILVYFKKRKEALKIDLGYHIQKKKNQKNPVVSSLLCCAANKSVSNFFGLKYLSTVGGTIFVVSWWVLVWLVGGFLKRNNLQWFCNRVHLMLYISKNYRLLL